MKLATQFHMLADCIEDGDMFGEVPQHLSNLGDAIRASELVTEAVLGEHREHHDFGPATCWSLACRLASKA